MSAELFVVKHEGKKYNIEHFLRFHPGGTNTLAALKNIDVTERLKVTNHSAAAFELLKDYRVDEQNERQQIRENGDLESLVDWKKPMFWQVGSLGPKYKEWVLAPVDRRLRLFGSDFIESLTITSWYMVPSVWIPVMLCLIYIGYQRLKGYTQANSSIEQFSTYDYLSLGTCVVYSTVLGLLLWPLIEYTIHRWLFHLQPPDNSPLLITLHFGIHGLHHKVPFDDRRLLFPPVPAAVLISFAYGIYLMLFPHWMAPMVLAGMIAGYVTYDLIHFYLHYGCPREGTYLYTMKRYHNQHHFAHHESGFGISCQFWDHIFGTAIALKKLSRCLKWY
ncbi:fatty acid 2-hydroxylase [Daktulosphaira vitifoliae]|uniref:fatty acid 2-hydroxylase n=1 Tax=Daktulosphaira vitifoliae TaxID=58002 RepID=UPI0021A97CA6|nr:fatty acid 2-hydroxylase [Daktulosphaira vitifoliae]